MGSSIRSATDRGLGATLTLLLALGPLVARADTGEETQAKALFQTGSKAYDLGDFEGALKAYSDAYQLAPRPGFLFNIAQCHRQLSNFERAAFFYQRFIDTSKPRAANVELATQLLEEMKTKQTAKVAEEKAAEARKQEQDRVAEEARQSELKKMDAPLATTLVPVPSDLPPPPPPPVAEADPTYKKWWFWTLIGVGVAAVAGGTATAVVVSSGRQPRSTTLMPIGSHN